MTIAKISVLSYVERSVVDDENRLYCYIFTDLECHRLLVADDFLSFPTKLDVGGLCPMMYHSEFLVSLPNLHTRSQEYEKGVELGIPIHMA